ncbi:hypothetical protein ACFLX2_01030 [Candidatus Dependentiae bacterium]
MEIDLEKYIKTAVVSIVKGVDAAAKETGFIVCIAKNSQEGTTINFDVAVGVVEAGDVGGGFALKVFNFGGGYEHKHLQTNRMMFGVYVSSRSAEEIKKSREELKKIQKTF